MSEAAQLVVLFTDDTLLHILSFLTARSLACLECSCKRFATKSCIGSAGLSAGLAVATQQTWSLVNEAARRWILNCSEQERAWLSPRREIIDESLYPIGCESLLGLMCEVEELRRAAIFGQSLENWATRPPKYMDSRLRAGRPYNATKSLVKMRKGCHRAQFTVASEHRDMLFGVVRPNWDIWKDDAAETVPGHCFYEAGTGLRCEASCESSRWEVRKSRFRTKLPPQLGFIRRHTVIRARVHTSIHPGGSGCTRNRRLRRTAPRPRPGQHDCLQERRAARCDG